MYSLKVKELLLNSNRMGEAGEFIEKVENISLKKINIFIGPNNSGKSKLLKEIRDSFGSESVENNIINKIDFNWPTSIVELDEYYKLSDKIFSDRNLNYSLKSYSNKQNQYFDRNSSIESLFTSSVSRSYNGDLKKLLEEYLKEKNYSEFLNWCGELFYLYLGTEERLMISKKQKNCGIDSGEMNFLSTFKFEFDALKELRKNIKSIFNKDVCLDGDTFGESIAIRVGNDLEYIYSSAKNKEDIYKLMKESILDDQGDGLKNYISLFLTLKIPEKSVLLLDEPEAFLHPPLARQVGELIGSVVDENKQIFVSTHSVEVLKGILSTCQDINILRITQPCDKKNIITKLDEKVLNNILIKPLLRVSQTMDGLFCDRVIITEAEADEIFYQELIEKINPQSGIHFVHGQGKSNITTIAKCYRSVNVNYDIIVDFDLLRQQDDLNKYFDLMNFESQEEKESYQKSVSSFRKHLDAEAEKKFIIENIDDLQNIEDSIVEDKLKKYKKQIKDEVYHKMGLNYFECIQKLLIKIEEESIKKIPQHVMKFFDEQKSWRIEEKELSEIGQKLKNLVEKMKKQNIHLVPCGEIESLMRNFEVEYTKNKNKWIEDSLEKISLLDAKEIEKDDVLYPFIMSVLLK